MSSSNTYEECVEIINDKKKLNHGELLKKWETFKKKYPELYKMLTLQEEVDLTILKYLCDTADKHNEKSKTEQLDNEFEVGEKLAHKYIYDKFPEPSDRQKDFIKETLRKKMMNGQDFANKNEISKKLNN
tara:strand:- start:171 stop:560 length:390 start_codon:yes stop_codon:yes gene_type:complete